MLRKFVVVFLFVGLSFVNAQSAKEIIDLHFKNTGGEKAWNQLNSLTLTGNATIGLGQTYYFIIYHQRPYFKNVSYIIDGKEVLNEGYDGKTGYTYSPDQKRNIVLPEYTPDSFENDLLNYDKKGFEVTFMGKETRNGEETYKIKLTKNTTVNYYYFSTKNYELLKEENPLETTDYSNFKTFDGLSFATRLEITPKGGEQYVIIFNNIEPNKRIDSAKFKFK